MQPRSGHSNRSVRTADDRPRILFIDHSAALGGGELSLLDIASDWAVNARVLLFEEGPFVHQLQERGLQVDVEPAAAKLQRVSRNAGLSSLLRALPDGIRLTRKLVRHAADVDLIYANSQKSMILAALVGKWTSTPVIWHLRDILSAEHFSSLNRLAVVSIARMCLSLIICNSQATQRAFAETGGPKSRSVVIPNGIDARPFEDGSARHCLQVRRDLGLPADTPLIGVFSRLAEWKGQHVLIEAITSLPDVHAVIVGDALFEPDRAYKEHLYSLIRRLDLEDRVHLLGFRRDVPRLMRTLDVVVHTSTAPEPFGRVVVEGMMAGRPVIASRSGGPAELIDDGLTGYLTRPGDASALRSRIRFVLSNPDEARRVAERGRRHAHRRYSVDRLLESIRQCVDSLLNTESTSPLETPRV